ncbi:MAG: hypothetical protein GY810_15515 [Aureispira sp.]|nr:hypothetical protein [Aureispira sp.]
MKNLITLLVLVLGIATQMAAQSEKTLVKSIALEDANNVVLALNGEIETSEWDKEYVRIETKINVENFDENILKRLVLVGRYNIETTNVDGKIVVEMPSVANFVTVKGVDLQEQLTFQVFVPKGAQVELPQKQTTTPTQSLF